MATQRYTQQRSLRQMDPKCRSKVLQYAPREHSAILLTCIMQKSVLKKQTIFCIFFEWPLKTGFAEYNLKFNGYPI